jgi:flavin-binding protein dodecin
MLSPAGGHLWNAASHRTNYREDRRITQLITELRGWRIYLARSAVMSVARIVEISSTSDKSFEDAIMQGIGRASKTLRDIKSAWVKDQEVTVQNNKVVAYKVILKVTFVLEAA